MRKKFILVVLLFGILGVMPVVFASGIGVGFGGGVQVEDFGPYIFQCGDRVLVDDVVQPWRIQGNGSCVEYVQNYSCNASLIYPADRDCWTDATCSGSPGTCCWENSTLKGCYAYDTTICLRQDNSLFERNQQYLFDGERYEVDVLVFDKNKIDDVTVDLVMEGATICICINDSGSCVLNCTTYDDFSGNCYKDNVDFDKCNVRIGEETPNETALNGMIQGYRCFFDVLDSQTMYGLATMSVFAENGLTLNDGTYAEVARWFLNPIISLNVEGNLIFETLAGDPVRPGTAAYSTVYVENKAEGGVLLDMFITGKNWPSANTNPLARCYEPSTTNLVNYLPLEVFSYYTENGAYDTRGDLENDDNTYSALVQRNVDTEGYVNIHRHINTGFEEAMFDEAEILQANAVEILGDSIGNDDWICDNTEKCIYHANLLYSNSPGMSITFKLELPEPCYGDFESPSGGGFFIWGEAI